MASNPFLIGGNNRPFLSNMGTVGKRTVPPLTGEGDFLRYLGRTGSGPPSKVVAQRVFLPPPTSQADNYLRGILFRESADVWLRSRLLGVQEALEPIIQRWANGHLLGISPSGSLSKGTANASGADIDLFVSLSPDVAETLREVFDKLELALWTAGFETRRQDVSINIKVGGVSVDVVPGRRQNFESTDHSLYRRKADSWTKTNVAKHARYVSQSGRTEEIRILKLWRDQRGMEWPSFCLELTAILALGAYNRLGPWAAPYGDLAANVLRVFAFLSDEFTNARIIDPANANNIVSDDLTQQEKLHIRRAAEWARGTTYWQDIVA